MKMFSHKKCENIKIVIFKILIKQLKPSESESNSRLSMTELVLAT